MTTFLGMVRLPATASSVPVARAFARVVLRGGGGAEDAVDSALYVVTELVTNAIVHGSRPGERVTVRLAILQDAARLEVLDKGRGVGPRLREPTDDGEGGRGLVLVDILAAKWGVKRVGWGGRSVWADLAMRSAA
ncbi:ATP-binding protein [Spongiactinospora rosea]|uniref:ATP-binding protein n=1 Tax=Spongiactinospora rosea TaxID=2248750 RepID=A0A366LWH9_9ACTN|nr:ATP-binding protein [Spongiactinospora rosea]RBQ17552.1 ATP-binding protein [Spongiactinospora rosea]